MLIFQLKFIKYDFFTKKLNYKITQIHKVILYLNPGFASFKDFQYKKN